MKYLILAIVMSSCGFVKDSLKVGKAVVDQGARETTRMEIRPIQAELNTMEYLMKRIVTDVSALYDDQKQTDRDIDKLKESVADLQKDSKKTNQDLAAFRKDQKKFLASFIRLRKLLEGRGAKL